MIARGSWIWGSLGLFGGESSFFAAQLWHLYSSVSLLDVV